MNDSYNPFGDDYSMRQQDFRVTESYRWVRVGITSMFGGYLILGPATVLALLAGQLIEIVDIGLLALLLFGALIASLALIMLGGGVLLRSPHANERSSAKKFFVAYAIAIACAVVARLVDVQGLQIVQRISQAYGMYFLIQYFQILAANRESKKLSRSADLLNRCFVFGLAILIGSAFVTGILRLPALVFLVPAVIFAVCFYFIWLRTLWLAIKATAYIQSDSLE